MKKTEMDLKQSSRENRKKRLKNKLMGGIGLRSQAGQKNRARIDSEVQFLNTRMITLDKKSIY